MQGTVGWTQVGGARFAKDEVHYRLVPQEKMIRCPCCHSPRVVKLGSERRTIQGLPVGRKYVFLEVEAPMVQCLNCGSVGPIDLGFAEPGKGYTKSFAKDAIRLVQETSIAFAAQMLKVSCHTIIGILQSRLAKNKK
ncbi:MAG: transposase family protein [Deltaproteobacteria bacterium]|jgi:transposase|nr:transposase family protein [Deltaproteobacteria bacterium]